MDIGQLRRSAQAALEGGDRDTALSLIEQGAEAGDTGLMVTRGRLAAQDKQLETALQWFRRAGEAGDPNGWKWGSYLLERRSPFTPRREELALAWCVPLVAAGDPDAMRKRGLIELAILRPRAGEALLRRAARAGDDKAMADLANRAHEDGRPWEAHRWATAAAEHGHEQCREWLAGVSAAVPDALTHWTEKFCRAEAGPEAATASALIALSAEARERMDAGPDSWSDRLDCALFALADLPAQSWSDATAAEFRLGLRTRMHQMLGSGGDPENVGDPADIEILRRQLVELAEAHEAHRRWDECLLSGEAVMELSAAEGRGAPVKVLLQVSKARFVLGRFAEALRAADEAEAGAIGTTGKTGGVLGPLLLDEAYAVKAQALWGYGRMTEARELIERAVALRRQVVRKMEPSDHGLLAPMLELQARILDDLGEASAARLSAEEAIAAAERGNAIRPVSEVISTEAAREILVRMGEAPS
ncbi:MULTISPECIES: hypothetical protein [Brevibacterium]|uniref:Sel1 repeat family protein n=1 Tax=Brevibacterium salitolerans TaxID=1403566 RepID=A0ABN2WKV3_9MICO|nr:hypothetical protein [Brevibacterium sp.]